MHRPDETDGNAVAGEPEKVPSRRGGGANKSDEVVELSPADLQKLLGEKPIGPQDSTAAHQTRADVSRAIAAKTKIDGGTKKIPVGSLKDANTDTPDPEKDLETRTEEIYNFLLPHRDAQILTDWQPLADMTTQTTGEMREIFYNLLLIAREGLGAIEQLEGKQKRGEEIDTALLGKTREYSRRNMFMVSLILRAYKQQGAEAILRHFSSLSTSRLVDIAREVIKRPSERTKKIEPGNFASHLTKLRIWWQEALPSSFDPSAFKSQLGIQPNSPSDLLIDRIVRYTMAQELPPNFLAAVVGAIRSTECKELVTQLSGAPKALLIELADLLKGAQKSQKPVTKKIPHPVKKEDEPESKPESARSTKAFSNDAVDALMTKAAGIAKKAEPTEPAIEVDAASKKITRTIGGPSLAIQNADHLDMEATKLDERGLLQKGDSWYQMLSSIKIHLAWCENLLAECKTPQETEVMEETGEKIKMLAGHIVSALRGDRKKLASVEQRIRLVFLRFETYCGKELRRLARRIIEIKIASADDVQKLSKNLRLVAEERALTGKIQVRILGAEEILSSKRDRLRTAPMGEKEALRAECEKLETQFGDGCRYASHLIRRMIRKPEKDRDEAFYEHMTFSADVTLDRILIHTAEEGDQRDVQNALDETGKQETEIIDGDREDKAALGTAVNELDDAFNTALGLEG